MLFGMHNNGTMCELCLINFIHFVYDDDDDVIVVDDIANIVIVIRILYAMTAIRCSISWCLVATPATLYTHG